MKEHPPNDSPRDSGDKVKASPDRAFVIALAKGLRILEAFTPEAVWLGNAEIADITGIPKPTVSRFSKALVASGHLHYSPARRQYRLGTGVLTLGFAGRAGNSVTDVVRGYLQRLADDFNLHAALVGRDKTNVIHLEVCHSSNTLMTLQLEIGSRIPLAGTASGHALLSRIPEQERKFLFGYLARRHEKQWAELETRVLSGIKEVETVGFASSTHGWQSDINGVAVPIVAEGESPVLAISCGGPSRHLTREKMAIIGKRLVADAAKIMDALAKKTAD
ncbi:IclR family transcriptional regulator [Rhodobacteraceae bacterium LMO-12]|nr:IclR family transcriptional regulator [Rhodobacteraceae bacterium LMO-JJ12]